MNINVYSVSLVRDKTVRYEVEQTTIYSPQDIKELLQTVLALNNAAVEKFGIIALTSKNKIAGVHIISVGCLTASIVHPRNIFQAAILNNACNIILFHNHPSGDPEPSSEDIDTTNNIINAGEIMGIKVIDHIITGESRYTSFLERGLMT